VRAWAALGQRWADVRGKKEETGLLGKIDKGGLAGPAQKRYWVSAQRL
jgi:hypothetical protein